MLLVVVIMLLLLVVVVVVVVAVGLLVFALPCAVQPTPVLQLVPPSFALSNRISIHLPFACV